MTLTVAIVGSGPAGLYAVERLVKAGARVEVYDRLPTPFGLVRYGVAADHQSTKGVARLLARAFDKGQARFFGGVTLGEQLSLEELRRAYDAVVLATGAPYDRRLGVPGEGLAGVVPSGRFVLWLNRHPDGAVRPLPRRPVREVVIVGAGNVALDVVRVLAKTPQELVGSDLEPEIAEELAAWPLARLTVLVRRGPAEVRFTPLELAELGRLERAQPLIAAEDLPPLEEGERETLAILRGWAAAPRDARPLEIRFRFHEVPLAFEGEEGALAAVITAGADGTRHRLPAQLAVTCIGYGAPAVPDCPCAGGRILHEGGRVAPGLYVVGWAGRGPTGTIPTNRAEAHAVAERLLAEVQPAGSAGAEGLLQLLTEHGCRPFAWADWQVIDAAERAAAPQGRVRRKLARWEEFEALRGDAL